MQMIQLFPFFGMELARPPLVAIDQSHALAIISIDTLLFCLMERGIRFSIWTTCVVNRWKRLALRFRRQSGLVVKVVALLR